MRGAQQCSNNTGSSRSCSSSSTWSTVCAAQVLGNQRSYGATGHGV
jgi:hypothetical protein